jgi:hypothetical protein
MIVFSAALVALRDAVTYVPDLPIIGFDNQVTVSTIAADEENSDYPATNLANNATNLIWKSGSTADQYLTITLTGDGDVDYVGIARHNLGSGQIVVSLEADDGGGFAEVVPEHLLADDTPAMFVFEAGAFVAVRVKLQPGATEPQAGVLFVGKSLTLLRSVPPGHMPLKYARSRQMLTAVAQNGDFLGNIVTAEDLATTFEVRLLDQDWYLENMQPFIDVCRDPFFLAWRPDTAPSEINYAWATNDPKPVISQFTGEIDISLTLAGLAV